MRTCQAGARHEPRSHEIDAHHVIPLSWGGPDTAANRIDLCPNHHHNTHILLDAYVHTGGAPDWTTRRQFGVTTRTLAAQAWAAAKADPTRYHPKLTA